MMARSPMPVPVPLCAFLPCFGQWRAKHLQHLKQIMVCAVATPADTLFYIAAAQDHTARSTLLRGSVRQRLAS